MSQSANTVTNSDVRGRVVTAIIAACAMGAGIGGTVIWMNARATRPASTVALPSMAGGPAARTNGAPAAADTGIPANIPGALPPGVPANIPAPRPPASAENSPSAQTEEPPAAMTASLTNSQAALALGNWYYDRERWDASIANYERAIKGGFDNPDVHTDLGNAYRFAGQPQQALDQYLTAQKQNPDHEQSLYNQGALWAVSLHNPAKGVAIWKAYLKRFPKGDSASGARQLLAKYDHR